MASGGWNRGKHLSEKHKFNLSLSHNGKKLSEEHKKKIKENNGKYWLGKKRPPFSEKCIKAMSEARKKEKNPFWHGGISFEKYGFDWTDDLRESIRKRDSYICQECGIHQEELIGWHKRLSIHHIDYNKKNLNPENLISLCQNCHQKTNFNREYWIEYFNNNFKI